MVALISTFHTDLKFKKFKKKWKNNEFRKDALIGAFLGWVTKNSQLHIQRIWGQSILKTRKKWYFFLSSGEITKRKPGDCVKE